jgi:hypothetical protein
VTQHYAPECGSLGYPPKRTIAQELLDVAAGLDRDAARAKYRASELRYFAAQMTKESPTVPCDIGLEGG